MKNAAKLMGIMVLTAMMTFALTSCKDIPDDNNGNGNNNSNGNNDGNDNGNSGGNGSSGGASGTVSTNVTSDGTILAGTANLAAKLAWLDRNAESHNTYIIEINANENIAPRTLEYTGAINITIILRGDSANRTIRLSSNGDMFTVCSNVTLILDNNITLQGHNGNGGNMVTVNGGTLKMNTGSTITGNTTSGGVYVRSGTFDMTGGIISGNGKPTDFMGGGVDVRGTFTMSGGTISGNNASIGGGVYVTGTFTMTGGTISSNNASGSGGGVYVGWLYNTSSFTMRGGTINNNTAVEYGGGVYVSSDGTSFTKTGGIITGYNSDSSNGNMVNDGSGVISRRGHAVYVSSRSSIKRKETTAGPEVNLSKDSADNWDQ